MARSFLFIYLTSSSRKNQELYLPGNDRYAGEISEAWSIIASWSEKQPSVIFLACSFVKENTENQGGERFP